MPSPLNISLLQSALEWENKQTNLSHFEHLFLQVPKESHIVLLPEMFATGFSMRPELAEDMKEQTVMWMREMAIKMRKIICGSVSIRENGNVYNRLIWMLPNGQLHYYDKRHLFAFAGEDKVFSPGNKRLIVQVNGWKLCLMVCYDLRFPVWSRQQGKTQYDALVFIANWPQSRTLAWKTLLQARAIENQCYVIGVNRVGQGNKDIYYNGDSRIIDPLGDVVQKANSGEEAVIHGRLDADKLQQIREKFPFLRDADNFWIG